MGWIWNDDTSNGGKSNGKANGRGKGKADGKAKGKKIDADSSTMSGAGQGKGKGNVDANVENDGKWTCWQCNMKHPSWHRRCTSHKCADMSNNQGKRRTVPKNNRWNRGSRFFHVSDDDDDDDDDMDVEEGPAVLTPPPDIMIDKVLKWMQDSQLDPAVINTIKDHRVATAPAPPPVDEVKLLQSSKAKLQNIDQQLTKIDKRVSALRTELQSLEDEQQELETKRTEVLAIYQKYSVKAADDTAAVKADYYEKLIGDIQQALQSGIPAESTPERAHLHRMVFGSKQCSADHHVHHDESQVNEPPATTGAKPDDADDLGIGFGESGFTPVGRSRSLNKSVPYVANADAPKGAPATH